MHINIYRTNLGLIVQAKEYNTSYSSWRSLEGYKLNGEIITKDHCLHNGIVLLQGASGLDSVEQLVNEPRSVVGYRLNDGVTSTLKAALKPYWNAADVGNRVWDERGEDYIYDNKEFSCVSMFYLEDYSAPVQSWKAVNHALQDCGEWSIDNLNAPVQMSVQMVGGSFGGQEFTQALDSLVTYNDLEKLLVPDFLIHKRPCSLSSETMYKIVRHHIKENIDHSVAAITSDYDFCFTVKKRIRKNTPKVFRSEQFNAKGKSFRPPRFTTRSVEHIEEQIFEMTDSKRCYQGYTPIAPLQAEDLETLAHNLKVYLDGLIAVINAPFKECPHCNGSGVVKGC